MTLIENISWESLLTLLENSPLEIWLTVFSLMYITMYLIKTFSTFKTIENCNISINGMKEPYKYFSFIESIPMVMFILLLQYNDDFIISLFNGDSRLVRGVCAGLCCVIVSQLYSINIYEEDKGKIARCFKKRIA